MELILIRHALPNRVVDATNADPDLSDMGVAQAQACADYLATEPLDAIYSSPMARARQTAVPLVAEFGLPLTIEPGVTELDDGASEYIPVEERKASGDPALMSNDPEVWATGAADFATFRQRSIDSLQQIVGAHPGQRVAVVCHGGVINVWLASVLGLPYEQSMFFPPNYTSLHRTLHARNGAATILSINETSHLRHTGLTMGLVDTPSRQK